MQKKKNLPLIIVLSIVGAALLGTGIFAIVKCIGKKNDYPNDTDYPDVRAYFEERAKIISVTPVKDSKNTKSEKEAVAELTARGFTEYPVISDYSIDGVLENSVNVSDDSSTMHPIYRTYFMTSEGDLWTITLVDGKVIATPSSYNLGHTGGVPIELSETGEIASYDLSTNSIYLTVPFDSTIDVRVVDRIDSATLESVDLEA